MNSYAWLTLAPDRARDMQSDAAVARYQREARGRQPGERPRPHLGVHEGDGGDGHSHDHLAGTGLGVG